MLKSRSKSIWQGLT